MDRTNGRGSPAIPTIDYSPAGPESAPDQVRGEIYQPSMRRLEADMGLPSGYLAIHERSGRGERPRCLPQENGDRPPAAPYYPQQEMRPNPRPDTIPVMPDNGQPYIEPPRQNYNPAYPQQNYNPARYYVPQPQRNQQEYFNPQDQMEMQRYNDPRYRQQQQMYYEARARYQQQQQYNPGYQQQQQYYDPRYQQQQYYDPRYQQQQYYDPRYQQQQYYDPRYQQQQNYDPRCQQQRYCDPRYQQQQYYNQGYQRQYYDPRYQQLQRNFDPRYETEAQFYDPNYQRNYDPRYQQQQYYNQQQQYYDPRYQQQYYNPTARNGYQEMWWERSQMPQDPSQRFIPSQDPTANLYREQWWNRAQQPPYEQYPNQYPQQYQYEQTQGQQFAQALSSLVGHSIVDFDPAVPPRLGCARAVSLALERTYGLPIRDQGCDELERDIQNYGWVRIDPRQMQAGDVIIGHRRPGEKGHSAIFIGNDQVFNNNSNSGRIQIDSASKFRSREFTSVNVYRKMR